MASEGDGWASQAKVTMLQETLVGDDSPENTQPNEDTTSPAQPTRSPAVIDVVNGRLLEPLHQAGRKSSRSTSPSHQDPNAGFAHVDGDIGGPGYNETKVDIIAVACPGADPVDTWTRDPLPDGYFGVPAQGVLSSQSPATDLLENAILSPTINRQLPMAAHLWIRQGIRKSVSSARVMLYRHRALADDVTLDVLAQDLLEQVWALRVASADASRPLFFITHSVGGLVVKLALLKASEQQIYRPMMYNCHGVTFFATPHRGSSYMSMRNLRFSIQELLGLQRPLPFCIADRLRLGDQWLSDLNTQFLDIASELSIWTFYETIDSQLSGYRGGRKGEVQFGAPLVSIKSGILGIRHENVCSVDSDHANCASFGTENLKTLAAYLEDLGKAVGKAERLSASCDHTPLRLKDHVKVELIGFYDDPESPSDTRLYFTKYHLSEFLEKGPEKCLEERLGRPGFRHAGKGPVRLYSASPDRGRTSMLPSKVQGVLSQMPFWKSTSKASQLESELEDSPGIVVTESSTRPSVLPSQTEPLARLQPIQSLTVPALPTAGSFRPRRGSDVSADTVHSEPVAAEKSPFDDQGPHSDAEYEADNKRETPGVGLAIRRRSDRAHRLSRAAALADLTAGFSRPDPSRRKFMWMHVPYNNPLWVKDIFEMLSKTQHQDFSPLFNNEHWISRHVQGRHSLSQPSFVKPACNYIPSDSLGSPRPPSMSRHGTSPATPSRHPTYLYLYLPYLHFDTYRSMIRRRSIINRRLRQGRARPVPKDIADLDSLELRVIWQYLGVDPPLNFRRTLDQFGYPSLKNTYARDDDQMLYKLTKKEPLQPPPDSVFLTGVPKGTETPAHSSLKQRLAERTERWAKAMDSSDSGEESTEESDQEVRDGNVLMVDQLWLWAIDQTTLATFFSKRESSPLEGTMFQQGDLRNSVYNELNGDLTGKTENALDLAAFIAFHAVTVLLDRTSHPDLEIFRIFEEAIGMLTERMTSNLKEFRMQTFREIPVDDGLEDPEENSTSSIKRRHRLELERTERENRENTSALLELRDMEDELLTLARLFEAQEAAIRVMVSVYTTAELQDATKNGQGYLHEALHRLDDYKAQTKEMIRRVDTTRKDYEKMLEMAQRQAQVDEVRWSRLQTELASSQNRAVMIFTVFTVVFLPLSFFTSLFGMNTAEWAGDLVPSISFIGAVSLPLTFVCIAGTLLTAFNAHVQGAFFSLYKYARSVVAVGVGSLSQMMPHWREQASERARDSKRKRRLQERKKKERAYDFWATVKKQRGSFYQIPELNRRKETRPLPARRSWRTKVTNE